MQSGTQTSMPKKLQDVQLKILQAVDYVGINCATSFSKHVPVAKRTCDSEKRTTPIPSDVEKLF